MNTRHTPGPWTAVEKFGVFGSVKGGVIREYTNGTSQDQLFMVCSVHDDNGGNEATNANARLISAAPDLLEALKAMEDRFGCRSSRQEDQPKTYGCHHMAETCTQCEGLVTGWKVVQAARAAITKATGEIECKS